MYEMKITLLLNGNVPNESSETTIIKKDVGGREATTKMTALLKICETLMKIIEYCGKIDFSWSSVCDIDLQCMALDDTIKKNSIINTVTLFLLRRLRTVWIKGNAGENCFGERGRLLKTVLEKGKGCGKLFWR